MSQSSLFRDVSISSLSGSSQTAVAASPAGSPRTFLMIENVGSANIGVNLAGGTAAIGGTGTATIVPNGSIILDRAVPRNAVTVVGTAGQPVMIIEAQ
ncbi:MAG: hypothetical protein KGL35_30480 [Bradyrhizobium sp.]|nr:hypothetical protein [Bradyrhizobium sp.]